MKKAVFLMGYCSIASIDELPAFYSHLFHGRLPVESVMSDAAKRYRRLGTVDPLGAVTARQPGRLNEGWSFVTARRLRCIPRSSIRRRLSEKPPQTERPPSSHATCSP
ncbi:hypothetical protein [Paenibacillus oceani]|uniref:Uncharacterized protein n=1 Tax=Paenibacillus oceani TaxID=2772510 RepID=A0A927GYJ1_9BACL|nr:hypothetical protein [Paenibacillus oceani]MBD2861961.1 hypothetical protein [Paenibacillus oceani]